MTKSEKEQAFLNKMQQLDDEINEKIENLSEEFREIMKIDRYQLDGEIIASIGNRQRFIEMHIKEEYQLRKLERKQRKVYSELYEKYKFNHTQKLDSRHEIEQWIERTSKYQYIRAVCENQKVLTDYLDRIMRSLQSKEYALKSLVELKRIEKL